MNKVNIICLGDIMPGGVLHGRRLDIDDNLSSYLKSADYRIATLECAIGNEPIFDEVKMSLRQDVIYAPDSDLDKLIQLNINCVSLANNHAFDLGVNGLINTINRLDELGIAHCGAGRNLEEASRPVIVELEGLKIGLLAFCDFRDWTVGYVPVATESSPGMNSLATDGYKFQIAELKKSVDHVLVMVHWGVEHTFWPTEQMLDVAAECLSCGASAVIGSHQHRLQPMVKYPTGPVFLGLGNSVFPSRYLRPPRPMFYPDPNMDTSSFPVTDSYPWVTEPTLKVWRPMAKIGGIGEVTLGRVTASGRLRYSRLVDDRRLLLSDKLPFDSRHSAEYRLVEFCLRPSYISALPYSCVYFMMRAMRKCFKILRNFARG